ncbi:MAG: LEPR-XLL domain-containing protein [Nitrospirales bacterium]
MAKARSFQKLQAWYRNQHSARMSEMSAGHTTRGVRARKASSFALESLEARILLSAELAAAVPVAPVPQNVDASATVSIINPTQATGVVQANSTASPHFSSLRIADFGRNYSESSWGSASSYSRTEAAVQWYAEHVDLTENQNAVAHFRQYNPTMQSWTYALDLYQFENQVSALPESSFLHVSEPTSVTLKDIYGNVMANYTIPTGGRFEAAVWTAKHYPFNLKDANLRAYNSERILNIIGGEAGVFLDAHAVGFADTYNIGRLTTINYGGGIQEYGGRRPGDPTFEVEYNADVVNWLHQLQGNLSAAGKWGAVNQATNLGYDQRARDQAAAIGGFETENLIAPDQVRGSDTVQALYDLTQRVTANGGPAILSGIWNSIPSDYTPGDYGTAAARQDMWRLSFYYLVKEAAGSPGKAYFDLTLPSNATNYIPADQGQWHAAYQVDVGRPTGGMTVAQSGSSPSDGAAYTVFSRSYSNAQVLFRSMDLWSSRNFGDTSAVTVSLNGNYRQLKEDGSLGPVTNTVQIRNSEGLILLPESGVPSNVVANSRPLTPVPIPVITPPLGPAVVEPIPVNAQPTPVSVVATTPPAGSAAEILAPPLLPIPTVSTISNDTASPPSPAPVAPPVPSTPEPVASAPPAPSLAGERSYTVAEMLVRDWRTTL